MNYQLSVGQYAHEEGREALGVFESVAEINDLLSQVGVQQLMPSGLESAGESVLTSHRFSDGRYLFDALSVPHLHYDESHVIDGRGDFFVDRHWSSWGDTREQATQNGWSELDRSVIHLVSTFFSRFRGSLYSPEAFFVTESQAPVTGLVRARFTGLAGTRFTGLVKSFNPPHSLQPPTTVQLYLTPGEVEMVNSWQRSRPSIYEMELHWLGSVLTEVTP